VHARAHAQGYKSQWFYDKHNCPMARLDPRTSRTAVTHAARPLRTQTRSKASDRDPDRHQKSNGLSPVRHSIPPKKIIRIRRKLLQLSAEFEQLPLSHNSKYFFKKFPYLHRDPDHHQNLTIFCFFSSHPSKN